MVFLIQNTQNRDSKALQLKLDQLIFVMAKANNSLLDLEEMDEKELDKVRDRYEKMAAQARKAGITYDSAITGTHDTDGVKDA
jgi:low affinity Fe/Cu permease